MADAIFLVQCVGTKTSRVPVRWQNSLLVSRCPLMLPIASSRGLQQNVLSCQRHKASVEASWVWRNERSLVQTARAVFINSNLKKFEFERIRTVYPKLVACVSLLVPCVSIHPSILCEIFFGRHTKPTLRQLIRRFATPVTIPHHGQLCPNHNPEKLTLLCCGQHC